MNPIPPPQFYMNDISSKRGRKKDLSRSDSDTPSLMYGRRHRAKRASQFEELGVRSLGRDVIS